MVQTRSASKRTRGDDSGPLKTTTVEHPLGNGNHNGADDPSPQEAPKKRRRGKRGELCRLNLDVLFLIAAYIHPIDLLNLARTCKSLRELLMDKSSAFVWKVARQRVIGLPACPAELTEPEYANLVYCACCHGCGKYTTSILWNIRRRYCPGCRIRQMRTLTSCNEMIRRNAVLATENVLVKGEHSTRVDRDQAASFMDEYRLSSDKKQFISDKKRQYIAILQHAKECEAWQELRELESKRDKKARQLERSQRIFERLRENGYSREIGYFGRTSIQRSRESDFRTSRPLTDKEWNKIRPEWLKIMNKYRSQRLETVIYCSRRNSLGTEFDRYIAQPSTVAPAIDLYPDVATVVSFPRFRDIIESPEEIRVDSNTFALAFPLLPEIVPEWRNKLGADLAGLVEVPLHLAPKNASGHRPGNTTRAEPLNAGLEKLQLACALFYTARDGVFDHLEVLLATEVNRLFLDFRKFDADLPITKRFGIQFLEEAPYIVHACGLDPDVATVNDMDRHNSRLKCLVCEGRTLVMNWRHAMWHAYLHHQSFRELADLRELPRWQLVGDEHIDAIQAVEQSIEGEVFPRSMRCLLCKPRVGDVKSSADELASHLRHWHRLKIERNTNLQRGVHYAPLGLRDPRSVALEMVEDGGQIAFRVPPKC